MTAPDPPTTTTDGPARRPARLIVVAGTATEIGKTWVAAQLATILTADGIRVAARKPAQSFDPADASPTDAEVLGAATGEAPDSVCPPHRWYPVPMAPPMAAEALDLRVPTVAELVDEVEWPPDTAVGLVETAGGVASPQAADGAVPELVDALAPDVVLVVADAGLGTINAVRLTAAALDGACRRQRSELIVHLNHFDPTVGLHRANVAWLADRDGLALTTSVQDLVRQLGTSA